MKDTCAREIEGKLGMGKGSLRGRAGNLQYFNCVLTKNVVIKMMNRQKSLVDCLETLDVFCGLDLYCVQIHNC